MDVYFILFYFFFVIYFLFIFCLSYPIHFHSLYVKLKLKGVKQHGRRWETILAKYKFNKVRTAVDLKDKWRLVMKSEQKKATSVL